MEPERAVVGFESLKAKQSAVNSRGALQIEPLAGLRIRPTRPVPHEDGHLIEIARATWPEMERPVVQVHMTTTLAGRVRAWGLHRRNTDRLFDDDHVRVSAWSVHRLRAMVPGRCPPAERRRC